MQLCNRVCVCVCVVRERERKIYKTLYLCCNRMLAKNRARGRYLRVSHCIHLSDSDPVRSLSAPVVFPTHGFPRQQPVSSRFCVSASLQFSVYLSLEIESRLWPSPIPHMYKVSIHMAPNGPMSHIDPHCIVVFMQLTNQ